MRPGSSPGSAPRGRAPYAEAPLHKDPNAEHPQLAKLFIAASIKVLGDNPWGWRIGSVIFGLIAIVAMYALVRSARGSPWLAVGAAGVMALDNLMIVHGRIATLDIYVVAIVLIAATLYMREAPLSAGFALGVAGCMKLIGLGVLPAFFLLEALRIAWARGSRPGIVATLKARAKPFGLMLGGHVRHADARDLGARPRRPRL